MVLTAATRDEGTTFFLAVGKVAPSEWTETGGPAARRLGKMEQSMGGTVFTLYDFGMDPALGPGGKYAEAYMDYTHRLPHALVYYDTNVMGRIPNAMTIAIPRCSNYNTETGNFVRAASQVGFAVRTKSKTLIAGKEEKEMLNIKASTVLAEEKAAKVRGKVDDPYVLLSGISATVATFDKGDAICNGICGKSKSKMKGVPMRKAIEPRIDEMDIVDCGVWAAGTGPKGRLDEEAEAGVAA